jgi:hypothetical protein
MHASTTFHSLLHRIQTADYGVPGTLGASITTDDDDSHEESAMGKVQGEGDYESAKKYDDAQAAFVKSGRVEQGAKDAEPKNQAEADEMLKAEEEGKSRSKGEDPLLRKGSASSKSSS